MMEHALIIVSLALCFSCYHSGSEQSRLVRHTMIVLQVKRWMWKARATVLRAGTSNYVLQCICNHVALSIGPTGIYLICVAGALCLWLLTGSIPSWTQTCCWCSLMASWWSKAVPVNYHKSLAARLHDLCRLHSSHIVDALTITAMSGAFVFERKWAVIFTSDFVSLLFILWQFSTVILMSLFDDNSYGLLHATCIE